MPPRPPLGPPRLDGLHGLLAAARDGDVIAEMVHSDRALLHDYLLSIGGRADDAAAIRRKVVGARGEHEAEARIVAVRAITDPDERLNAAQALLRSFPGDPRIAFEVAEAYDVAGQPDSAIARYDESLAAGLREPFRRRARLQRAGSLRVLSRTDEVISEPISWLLNGRTTRQLRRSVPWRITMVGVTRLPCGTCLPACSHTPPIPRSTTTEPGSRHTSRRCNRRGCPREHYHRLDSTVALSTAPPPDESMGYF